MLLYMKAMHYELSFLDELTFNSLYKSNNN